MELGKNVVWIILVAVVSVLVVMYFNDQNRDNSDYSVIAYVDTIPYLMPVPVDSAVVRYVTKHVTKTHDSTLINHVCDTDIVLRDDSVVIPITQKVYRDSLYTAYVSGYDAKLDSIKVVNRNIVYSLKKNKILIGPTVGIGYSGNVRPFIGIGVTIPLFSIDF